MTSDEQNLSYVIHHTRAMRRLKSDPVPEEMLLELVDAANQGPTGSNKQNASWIIVRDAVHEPLHCIGHGVGCPLMRLCLAAAPFPSYFQKVL